MDRVELLTVQDRFQLSHIGLTITPDLPVPRGRWKNLEERVLVVTPGGEEFEATAQFNLTHFNIRDPNASIDQRSRVVISLPSVQEEQVPIGSRLLVSIEVRNAVLPGSEV